jgi:manganese efflux pump family protein
MELITVLVIAVGLSMDAFAVSLSKGMTLRVGGVGTGLKLAAFFGAFQAFMPWIGWLGGRALREQISTVDHWVAFGLLLLIGGKMIYEAFRIEVKEEGKAPGLAELLILSVATSIDALVVGVSFAFLKMSILIPILVIGTVTFALAFLGVLTGKRLGRLFGKKVEIAGGLILIGIGVKILLEGLMA